MTATKTTSMNSTTSSHAPESDLKDQVKVLGDDLKELARMTKDALGDRFGAAKDGASSLYEHGKDRVAEYGDRAAGYTRENPLKSLLYAAGAGALLGLLLRRR